MMTSDNSAQSLAVGRRQVITMQNCPVKPLMPND
jgi:hypothetical protein